MNNADLIHQFYEAFARRDAATMGACYHDEARFNDPAFVNLDAAQVRAMWRMLCEGGKDLTIEHDNVQATETEGRCHWEARYTFSQTGPPVHNVIEARFAFKDGKILTHTDHFNFWRWSRQAFGLPGLLLGWTPFLQKKVQATVAGRLAKYMEKVARE